MLVSPQITPATVDDAGEILTVQRAAFLVEAQRNADLYLPPLVETLDEIRNRAASEPDEVDAQLDVADLDLSGGHIDDAFGRLLDLFPKLDAAGRNTVRERLLELFQVVGVDDPRVSAARQRLAMLLY